MLRLLFVFVWFIEQEPLTEQEIEDLVAEFLEVESKVSYYSLLQGLMFLCLCLCFFF